MLLGLLSAAFWSDKALMKLFVPLSCLFINFIGLKHKLVLIVVSDTSAGTVMTSSPGRVSMPFQVVCDISFP